MKGEKKYIIYLPPPINHPLSRKDMKEVELLRKKNANNKNVDSLLLN